MKTLKKSRKLKFGKLKPGKLKFLLSAFCFLFFFQLSAFPQTGTINVDENHTGHKIYGLPTPTAGNEAATKAYADSVGGGGGGGTVTSITATTPIVVTPSPLVATGVISIADTAVTPGSYTNTNLTVDAKGRITAASNGSGGSTVTPAALTKTDDTNVTLTLGGTPATALLQATSLTLGWTGTLGISRGGTGAATAAAHNYFGNNTAGTAAPGFHQIAYSELSGTPTVPADISGAHFLTTQAESGLSAEFSLGSLASGILKQTVSTGVATPAIATSGTDYAPATSGSSILKGNAGGFSNATSSDVVGLFTGCSGTQYLGADGACHTASGGSGVTSIATTSPITGGTITTTGTIGLDVSVDHAFSTSQTITLTDTGTANIPYPLTINHNSSGTPTTFFGTGISLQAKSDTTSNRPLAEFAGSWGTATDASRSSFIRMRTANNTGFHGQMTFYDSGFLTNSANADAGGAYINSTLGYRFNNATPTSGTILQSNGSAFAGTSVVWPAAAPTTGQIIIASSSNWVASTPAYPNAAGTAGYTLRSDGTNFATYPQDMINSSVASQATFSTSDIYIAGSNVTVAAGDFKAKGQYHCLFDMTKSAGTGAIVITLRVGTAGSTSDAAIQTYTFGAGTAIADSGLFDVWATFRTVGSGTSAVITSVCYGRHNAATTGLFNNAQQFTVFGSPAPSSGFATNTATQIGLSFNGSTAFAGTGTIVQAQLLQ